MHDDTSTTTGGSRLFFRFTVTEKSYFPFWQELVKFNINTWEAFSRNKLIKYQVLYDSFAFKWIQAKEKVSILEKFLSPDDKDRDKKIMDMLGAGYWKEMQTHETELNRIMNDISNTLKDKKSEADFKAAISLSTIAIVIAVISIVVSVFK